jgi:Flp pilus assembly protein TadG
MGGQRGQSLIELALIAPLVLLLVIGVIEIGRIGFYTLELTGAARAGAAYGAQNPATAVDTSGMQTAAKSDVPDASTGTTATAGLYNFAVASEQLCQCWNTSGGTQAAPTACSASLGFPTCTSPDISLAYVQVTTSANVRTILKYLAIPNVLSLSRTATMPVGQ